MNLNELVSKVKSLKEAFLLEDNKILPDSYGNPSLRPESARAIARKEFHDGIEKLVAALSETHRQTLLDYVREELRLPITNWLDCFGFVGERFLNDKMEMTWSSLAESVKKRYEDRKLKIESDRISELAGKSFSTYTLLPNEKLNNCFRFSNPAETGVTLAVQMEKFPDLDVSLNEALRSIFVKSEKCIPPTPKVESLGNIKKQLDPVLVSSSAESNTIETRMLDENLDLEESSNSVVKGKGFVEDQVNRPGRKIDERSIFGLCRAFIVRINSASGQDSATKILEKAEKQGIGLPIGLSRPCFMDSYRKNKKVIWKKLHSHKTIYSEQFKTPENEFSGGPPNLKALFKAQN